MVPDLSPSLRLFGPLPPDVVPECTPSDELAVTDPRRDGRPSQGSFVALLPASPGNMRGLGVLLDADGHLFSVSDSITRVTIHPTRGNVVAKELAVALFDPQGQGHGYMTSLEAPEELLAKLRDGSKRGIGKRDLSDAEVQLLRSLANDVVVRARASGMTF